MHQNELHSYANKMFRIKFSLTKARLGSELRKALHNNQVLPLAILWPSFVPTGVIIRKQADLQAKLSAKQAKMAVLDFIARIQRRYTTAQHQTQIIVAHSNASGNSDIATFPLAETRRIL